MVHMRVVLHVSFKEARFDDIGVSPKIRRTILGGPHNRAYSI